MLLERLESKEGFTIPNDRLQIIFKKILQRFKI